MSNDLLLSTNKSDLSTSTSSSTSSSVFLNYNNNSSLDQLVNRIVFPAGLDKDYHPILVICASRFPGLSNLPSGINFTTIVKRSLELISPITSIGPYSFIIFSSPSNNGPNVKQIVSTYLMLDRPIRKNLKNLFLVHPSFWSKVTMQVFLNGIVSWKMGNKIRWISNLSNLAREIPIHQICIPPEVYKFDLTLEPTITVPISRKRRAVFETDLVDLMGRNAERGLPQVILDCGDCIRKAGLHSEGLFRRPPSSTTLKIVREAYDRGHPVNLLDYSDSSHLSASLLKLFLRSLPQPIFGEDQFEGLRNCPRVKNHSIFSEDDDREGSHVVENSEAVSYIKAVVLDSLKSRACYVLLEHVIGLCYEIACSANHNKMDAHNLATCLAPNLLRSNDLMMDTLMCQVHLPNSNNRNSTQILASINSINGKSKKGDGNQLNRVDLEKSTSFGSILKLMINYYPIIFERMTKEDSSFELYNKSKITIQTTSNSSSPLRSFGREKTPSASFSSDNDEDEEEEEEDESPSNESIYLTPPDSSTRLPMSQPSKALTTAKKDGDGKGSNNLNLSGGNKKSFLMRSIISPNKHHRILSVSKSSINGSFYYSSNSTTTICSSSSGVREGLLGINGGGGGGGGGGGSSSSSPPSSSSSPEFMSRLFSSQEDKGDRQAKNRNGIRNGYAGDRNREGVEEDREERESLDERKKDFKKFSDLFEHDLDCDDDDGIEIGIGKDRVIGNFNNNNNKMMKKKKKMKLRPMSSHCP